MAPSDQSSRPAHRSFVGALRSLRFTISDRVRREAPVQEEALAAFVREYYPDASDETVARYLDGDPRVVGWSRRTGAPRFLTVFRIVPVTTPETGEVAVVETHLMLATPELRGAALPQLAGAIAYVTARRRHPGRRIFVFALCETATAYVGLVRTGRVVFPRHDLEMPRDARAVRDACGRRIDAARWDGERGVLRGEVAIRPEHARIPGRHAGDPHVRFFLAANPGLAGGDCLALVADAGVGNVAGLVLNPLARKLGPLGRMLWPSRS